MGDTLGAYRKWLSDADDRRELAPTYSGMVFGVCRQLGAKVLAVSARDGDGELADGDIRIIERSIPFHTRGGILHHVGRALYAVRVLAIAARFRPAVVVSSTQLIWVLLAPLSWFGVRIVPSLHNTLWPKGHRPRNLKSRLLHWSEGVFWRRHAYAGIAVSDEIVRQVTTVADDGHCEVRAVIPQYPESTPMLDPPPARRPFRVLFVGRLEPNKGIWEILLAATALERQQPGAYAWEFAGTGSQARELEAAIRLRGLTGSVKCSGWLGEEALGEAMTRCHVLAVPTRKDFAEGFQKVTAEGVLFGRPVVTTAIVPAVDTFGAACEVCEPGSAASLASAVRRLADDPRLYEDRREACRRLRRLLFDRSLGYRRAISDILGRVAAERAEGRQGRRP